MDNPKVSIIVPIYRVEEYIERCAESLFAQTFDDIEYIFVDDCSPDKSVEILQRTLEKYPHRKRLTRIERVGRRTAACPLFDDKGFNWPLVITRFIAIAMTGWMCMP